MKKFIFEIVLYIFIFTIFSAAMSVIIYSFDRDDFITNYEGPEMVKKYNYIKDNPFVYDTLFFGSSITLRGIIPEQFDELNGNKTNSFNMGIGGFKMHRITNFIESSLRDDKFVKTIFVELRSPVHEYKNEGKDLYKTNAVTYAASPKNLIIDIDYALKRHWSNVARIREIRKNVRKFVYKYLGVGISKHLYLLTGIEKSPEVHKLQQKTIEEKGFTSDILF